MLETSQQSSRITFLLTDLVMAILKIDPSNNQVVEYVNINSCLQVTAMQKQVVTILTGLFESQANNRVAIFSEILSIMCQIYNNKIVSKLYSLSEATQLITARGSSITVVFAALMTALQSLIKSGWSKFTKDDLTTVGIDSVRECMSEIHGHCSHFVKKLMEVNSTFRI